MDPLALQKDALIIDTHNDTIVAHIREGGRSLCGAGTSGGVKPFGTIASMREPFPVQGYEFQIDLPKMAAAGIDCAFYAVDVTLAIKNRLTYALDGFGFLLNDLEASGTEAVIVRSTGDILEAKARGVPALVLAVEHADGLERSLYVLRSLYEFGVRSIGLTHNISSLAADGCLEARDGVGLTAFGVALVKEMNRLGVIVDLAHVSPGAFFHALDVVERPALFSHGNARALCDHPRNLTDEQLKALAANGGVIGLSYVPMFVDEHEPTVERLLQHVDHIVEVAGIDVVGLGSDFDGGGDLLSGATQIVDITGGLLDRGYSEADVRKILGGNMLRFWRAAID